jgi:hypothetical protein
MIKQSNDCYLLIPFSYLIDKQTKLKPLVWRTTKKTYNKCKIVSIESEDLVRIDQLDGSQKTVPSNQICFVNNKTYEELIKQSEMKSVPVSESMPVTKPLPPIPVIGKKIIKVLDKNDKEIFTVPLDDLGRFLLSFADMNKLTLNRKDFEGPESMTRARGHHEPVKLTDTDMQYILGKLAQNNKWIPTEGKEKYLEHFKVAEPFMETRLNAKSVIKDILANKGVN